MFISEHADGYRVLVLCAETLGPLHTGYTQQVGPRFSELDDAEALAVVLAVLAQESMIPVDLTELDAARLARFATPTTEG